MQCVLEEQPHGATIKESLVWATQTAIYASNIADFAALTSTFAHDKAVAASNDINGLVGRVPDWDFGSNMSVALFYSACNWDWASNMHNSLVLGYSEGFCSSPIVADTFACYSNVMAIPLKLFDASGEDKPRLGWTDAELSAAGMPLSAGQLLATLYGAFQHMQKTVDHQNETIRQLSAELEQTRVEIGL